MKRLRSGLRRDLPSPAGPVTVRRGRRLQGLAPPDSLRSERRAAGRRRGGDEVAEHGEGVSTSTLAADAAHVIHSWSVQGEAERLVIDRRGRRLSSATARGREYLDFASQVVNANLGHQHPGHRRRDRGAGRRASRRPLHRWPSTCAPSSARLLAELTPGDLSMSFFTSGGAEATENALKLARWYTGRQKIVARYRSYHGATAGAAAVSGDPRRWPAEPAVPGVARIFDPYPYRCAAGHPGPLSGLLGRPSSGGGPAVRRARERRGGHPRDRHGRQRCPRASGRLPAVDPRGLRPSRHPADPRRGDGRVRPHGTLVRLRALGRRAGHHDGGQGHDLRLPADGRHGRQREAAPWLREHDASPPA